MRPALTVICSRRSGGADDEDEMTLLYENAWYGSEDDNDLSGESHISIRNASFIARLPTFQHHGNLLALLVAAYQQGRRHAIKELQNDFDAAVATARRMT